MASRYFADALELSQEIGQVMGAIEKRINGVRKRQRCLSVNAQNWFPSHTFQTRKVPMAADRTVERKLGVH